MTKATSGPRGYADQFQIAEWMDRYEADAPAGDPTLEFTGPVVKVRDSRSGGSDRQIKLPDFRKEVKRGAKLMDEKMPGWWKHIDTSSLDLRSEQHCVLGQTWRHYSDGAAFVPQSNYRSFAAKLFGTDPRDEAREQGARYGFDITKRQGGILNYQIRFATGELQHAVWQAAWEELTREWLRAVRKRQVAAAKAVSA